MPFTTPTAPGPGTFRECVVATEPILDSIAANPSAFYLNLHSQPSFGPGAIRGQLQGI